MDWVERGKVVQKLQARVAEDPVGEGFFNRQAELGGLLARLAVPPTLVTVVIGPNNCGKSKLLKQLKKIWLADEELAATSPVFYFDMREEVWSTPQDAAVHVHKRFLSWARVFQNWVEKVKNGLDMAVKVAELLPSLDSNAGTSSNLSKVMESLCQAVGTTKVTYPIFILDEVDRLKDWDKKDLVTFFGFFKSMVKQNNRAYLILSSSDDFFRVWLRNMFNPGQWEPFGVGCFPLAEARKFFCGYSLRTAGQNLPESFQDSDWDDIYAVCGGSPLLLNSCALSAALNKIIWKEAAFGLMSNSLHNVQIGLAATKTDLGFSGDKYGVICVQIVQNGFVGLKVVLGTIYNGDKEACKEEMLAMVLGNFIHLRYVTPGTAYGDIAFSDTGGEVDVVMARSPADRAAMKMELEL